MDGDPHHYKMDPDPSFYFNAVPDPTFHFNTRPLVLRPWMARYFEPFNFDSVWILIKLFSLLRFRIHIQLSKIMWNRILFKSSSSRKYYIQWVRSFFSLGGQALPQEGVPVAGQHVGHGGEGWRRWAAHLEQLPVPPPAPGCLLLQHGGQGEVSSWDLFILYCIARIRSC